MSIGFPCPPPQLFLEYLKVWEQKYFLSVLKWQQQQQQQLGKEGSLIVIGDQWVS